MALLSPNTWFCSLAWFFLLIPLYVGSSRGSLGQGLTTFRAFRYSYPRLSKLSATLRPQHNYSQSVRKSLHAVSEMSKDHWVPLSRWLSFWFRSPPDFPTDSGSWPFHDLGLRCSYRGLCHASHVQETCCLTWRNFPSGSWSVSRQSLRDGLAQQQLSPSQCESHRSWLSIAIANCTAFVATFTYLSKDA